ncbi:ABC transporter permease [Vibrio nomapromontoriensis]|uniref:ABC transporter permease n=1 Tax=Vibrio nomapromontoriensis TaxID=2910246 RepID=UPI003D13A781
MSQQYSSLVWRRFRRNKMAIASLWLLGLLVMVTVFAPFFSPNDPTKRDSNAIYAAPAKLHFFDSENNFSVIPFVYGQKESLDPVTFLPVIEEDTSEKISLTFFTKGWQYTWLGLSFESHLMGLEDGRPFFLIGADSLGRDLLARCFFGSRITLIFAATVVFVVMVVGTLVGMFSGYYGGRFDYATQRIAELALAFPAVPLYLALIAVMPKTADSFTMFIMLILILSSLQWAFVARQVRAQALSLRALDYVKAAQSVGAKDMRIVIKHILPNVTSNVIVLATIMLPGIVLTESFFSFLAVGVKAPMFSWGSLLNAAGQFQTIGSYPWLLSPVLFILITVLGFNALGDGLRDAADPYSN